MKFGVCKTFDMAGKIKSAGYDYIEANLSKVASFTKEEFDMQQMLLADAGITCESANSFFPSEIALVGDGVDFDDIREYVEIALYRASVLGIKVAVLGSGKARNIPKGYDRSLAVEQFKKVVRICADVGRKYGIKIALEHLNTGETNLLNTVYETYEFCKEIADENVGMVVDFFHMFKECENVSILEKAKDYIFHLHIARPNDDRKAPCEEDIDTLKIWADAVKKIGYNGRMSLECTSKTDFDEALENMANVKYIFE